MEVAQEALRGAMSVPVGPRHCRNSDPVYDALFNVYNLEQERWLRWDMLVPATSESCRKDLQLEGHDRAASRVALPAQQCATVLLPFREDSAEITFCQGGT